jgi:tetratricopeptide (TPR) repeat protein
MELKIISFVEEEREKAIRALETLKARYPGDARIAQMLQDAQFKAQLEAKTQVKEKRWIIPWRAMLVRTAMVLVILGLLFAGVWMVRAQLLPMLANAQLQRQQMQLLNQAKAALAAGNFDEAEQRFQALLALAPDHPEASNGLIEVDQQRKLAALYNEAVIADNAGLRELARSTRVTRQELKWQDWTRYSNRQQRKIPMGGVVGSYTLETAGLEPLWPLLWAGQWAHVGKGAVMGLGRYTVEAA